MAVIGEPRERLERHLRDLQRYDGEGKLLGVRQLLEKRDYPDQHNLGAFYAQSASLVEFLVKERDHQTLIHFLRDGVRQGYATGLKDNYGWTFEDLERRWRHHAFTQTASIGKPLR
jgi:hypothetical protein